LSQIYISPKNKKLCRSMHWREESWL